MSDAPNFNNEEHRHIYEKVEELEDKVIKIETWIKILKFLAPIEFSLITALIFLVLMG